MKSILTMLCVLVVAVSSEKMKEKRGLYGLGLGYHEPIISHAPIAYAHSAPSISISHAPIISHAPVIASRPIVSVSHAVAAPTILHAPIATKVASSYQTLNVQHVSHTPLISHAPIVAHAPIALAHAPIAISSYHAPAPLIHSYHSPYTTLLHHRR